MNSVLSAASSGRTAPVVFSGQSMAYLKLWLVNLLLSILTLGIYSAWAKVRNNQYLFGHTSVEGHRLQYLATPMQILRGRIIAVLVFGLYALLSSLNPALSLMMTLLFLLALPWLILQGLRFTLRMTAYRNVRFSFDASYGGILVHFILLPLIGVFTFYLAMPWVIQRIQKYTYEHISYGGQRFTLPSSAGYYYKVILLCILVVILVGATAATLLAGSLGGAISPAAMAPAFLVLLFLNFAIAGLYQSMIRNHIMNCLHLNDLVSFRSSLSPMRFTWLMLTNALLLVLTLGLAYPVTQIRKNRMLAEATEVHLQDGIDQLVNTVASSDSAIGEEAAGFFDADLSLT